MCGTSPLPEAKKASIFKSQETSKTSGTPASRISIREIRRLVFPKSYSYPGLSLLSFFAVPPYEKIV